MEQVAERAQGKAELERFEQDIERLVRMLEERGALGIDRYSLGHIFEGDRRARRLVEAARKRGLAPIVSTKRAVITNGRYREATVYRIAQSADELARFRHGMVSRIRNLAESVRGLERAWRWHDPQISPLLDELLTRLDEPEAGDA